MNSKKLIFGLLFLLGLKPALTAQENITVIDFKTMGEELLHNALGFHHGIGEEKPHDSLVLPVKPILVRTYDEDFFSRAKELGCYVHYQNNNREAIMKGILENDWNDWVEHSLERAKIVSGTGFFVDIANEPNYLMRKNDLDWKSFFPAWEKAYKVIKDYDSSIRIVGPSIDNYFHGMMKDFLVFCRENNCTPDILAFHSSNYLYLHEETSQAWHLIDSLELNIKDISVHEYAIRTKIPRPCPPGVFFRYLPLIEDAKLMSAALANHRNDNLSCAVTEGDIQYKRSLWYALEAYASMTGKRVTVKTLVSNMEHREEIDGIATWDQKNKKATILLGCGNKNLNSVKIKIVNLPDELKGRIKIVGDRLPYSGYSAFCQPFRMIEEVMNHENQIKLKLPYFNRYEGYIITLTAENDDSL